MGYSQGGGNVYPGGGGGGGGIDQATLDAAPTTAAPPPQNVVLLPAGVTDVDPLLADLPDLVGLNFHVTAVGAQITTAATIVYWPDDDDPSAGASSLALPRGAHGFFYRDGAGVRVAYQTVNP